MAVSISVDLSYVGPGDYPNTSKIAVNVYAHWSASTSAGISWNAEGATVTVTIDGVSDSLTATFNTNKTLNGSQSIYSSYWNISHDENGSARTVVAVVTYPATSNSGTLQATDSLNLAAIDTGGSGGSGEDTDDPDIGGGDSGGGADSPDGDLSGLYITNGSSFDKYLCYIDTYHEVTTEMSKSYTFDETSSSIKFVIPEDQAKYTSVNIYYQMLYIYLGDEYYIDYYINLLDENDVIIGQVVESYESEGLIRDTFFTIRPEGLLSNGSEYRITTNYYGGDSAEVSGSVNKVSVHGERTDMINEYIEYDPYIDSGTDWIMYT